MGKVLLAPVPMFNRMRGPIFTRRESTLEGVGLEQRSWWEGGLGGPGQSLDSV